MKRLSLVLAACLALFSATSQATTAAAARPPVNSFTPAQLGINAVALSTGPTFTVSVNGYSQMTVYVVLTRSAATTLLLTCTAGPNGSVQAAVPVANVNTTTGGVGLVPSPGFSYASPTTGTYRFQVAPLNDDTSVCTLTGASASGSDLVSAYVRLSVPL